MTEKIEHAVPRPPSEMTELAFFSGEWEAEGTFFTTPFSSEKSIRMSIDVNDGHRGFWTTTHTMEHRTTDNPEPLEATYIWGYHSAKGLFTAEWFDSNGGRAHQESPGWEAERLVFTGSMTNGGFTFALRDSFTRRSDAEYHHLGEVDLGEGWIPVDEETVRRRSGPTN